MTGGWFSDGVFWFENPRGAGGLWKAHVIGNDRHTEGLIVVDVDGNVDIAHPCQVTWRVVGISNPKAQPYGCEWRLDSYISNCLP